MKLSTKTLNELIYLRDSRHRIMKLSRPDLCISEAKFDIDARFDEIIEGGELASEILDYYATTRAKIDSLEKDLCRLKYKIAGLANELEAGKWKLNT